MLEENIEPTFYPEPHDFEPHDGPAPSDEDDQGEFDTERLLHLVDEE